VTLGGGMPERVAEADEILRVFVTELQLHDMGLFS
jgi:hypothetical protein